MLKRHIVLVLLALLSVITFLDRLAIAAAGPRIQDELNISTEQWGWVLGAFVLAYGLFEIPTGAMGDRLGQRRVITRIVVWWSAFTALTGAATGFFSLISTRFLFGIGEAGAYPNMAGVIARSFPPTERARAQGVVWAASRAGGALAPLIIVPLQAWLGWRAAFAVLGAIGIVWAAVWYAWFRDPQSEQHQTQHLPLRTLAANPQLWLIVAMYGCYAWSSWFYFSWMPTFLVKGRGFKESEMAVISALPFTAGVLANLAGGALGDALVGRFGLKAGRRIVGSASLAAGAAIIGSTALTDNRTLMVVLLSLGLGVTDLMLPTAWAVCLDIGGSRAATVSGAMNTAGQAGGFSCTVLFGYIVAHTGSYNAPLFVIAAMLVFSSLLFLRIDPTRKLDLGTF